MTEKNKKTVSSENDDAKQDSSRTKILDAAETVFSEKGFDGARVDEIALKAGLNKAMLYYYFKSKELLLEALVMKNIKETEKIVDDNLENITNITEENMKQLMDNFIGFIDKKKSILRIISIEGFKNIGNHKFIIFDLLDPIYEKVIHLMKQAGKNASDTTDILIKTFFISTVPLIMFYTLGEKWAEHYRIGVVEARDKFVKIFKTVNLSLY